MLICSAAIARAADQSETALEVLGAAESQLLEVSEKGIVQRPRSARPDRRSTPSARIDNLYKQSREVTGLATDFTELDRMTSGLQKGELIIIAARPSMGKTAFAINIAQNAAINQQGHRRRLQSRNEQGVAAAPHACLPGLGRPAEAANRLPGPRRSRRSCRRLSKQLVESRLFIDDTRRHLAGRNARQGAAPQADRQAASTWSWSITCS